MKSGKELFDQLNAQDETTEIEAKGAFEIGRTVLESVCAFANEPDLGGGYILIGANKDESSLFPYYTSENVDDPDKLQMDLATQCNGMFNIPIRPIMKVDKVNGNNVIVVRIEEVEPGQKPVFFQKDGLPKGAYRRIGSTDHRCGEDDLRVFYSDHDSYDRIILNRTSLDDLDENAISQYRTLRAKVNSEAEELIYEDKDLLLSLGCLDTKTRSHFTLAGLLLFGKSAAQRRELPMFRADYIRVPGNVWVEDPDDRFRTIDMRGGLISLTYRLVEAVNSDLPKGFMLAEGDLQADNIGLPIKALREAIVNALMHRSYRENSPIQVIRYDNRIEIRNPGYSLKSEDHFGSPGSKTRNPVIAAVFHETNLAETKGSGIRAMKRLLHQANLAPPTFESDREANSFSTRLLLHHFLSKEDLDWLQQFSSRDLNDNQKRGLIMLRELGAIDNLSYRQISDSDTLKASNELRQMRDFGLITPKGKGRATYYVFSKNDDLNTEGKTLITEGDDLNTEGKTLITEGDDLNTEGRALITEGNELNTEGEINTTLKKRKMYLEELPEETVKQIEQLGEREKDKDKVNKVVLKICENRAFKLSELSIILERKENYLSRTFIKPLIDDGDLCYSVPDMINHPDQAYYTKK
jgi:ATP-dependent DNA helicase RecG